MRGSAWKVLLAALSLAGSAQAQDCKPDASAANIHFSEALAAIYKHQGFAWACAPYIGDGLAKSNVVHVEGLLEESGFDRNAATIRADEINAKAKADGEAGNTAEQLRKINATKEEATIACSQLMDEEYQKFRVARAKMLEARCDHR